MNIHVRIRRVQSVHNQHAHMTSDGHANHSINDVLVKVIYALLYNTPNK